MLHSMGLNRWDKKGAVAWLIKHQSQKQSIRQLLTGEIKENRKEPKQSKHKNKLKFSKTQSKTKQTNNAQVARKDDEEQW